MTQRTLSILSTAGLILAAAALACGGARHTDARGAGASDDGAAPPETPAVLDAVSAANTAFALTLYRALPADRPNAFFSPFSISTAFAMVQGGARGRTAGEIASVFHFPGADTLHRAYRDLLAVLAPGEDASFRLDVANRLWGGEGFAFLPGYLALTGKDYGAELATLDFQGAPEGARGKINDWVSEKTRDKIPDLLPPGSIDARTRLVLTNAVYFKGTWADTFHVDDTHPGPFRKANGDTASVPFMHRTGSYLAAEFDGFQALEIPYRGDGNSMVMFLPHADDGLPALAARFSPDSLDVWLQALTRRSVELTLPRFTLNARMDLGGVLAQLGMPAAFNPPEADFSGMDGKRDLFLSAAVHQAYVKVDEHGTEAAAATAPVMSLSSVRVPQFRFTADHPFLFLIRDRATGTVLFLGRVGDPGRS